MPNHKTRTIEYQGFVITLEYDPTRFGWIYSLTNSLTSMDYGSSNEAYQFIDALCEARDAVDDILLEVKDYLEESALFAGDEPLGEEEE